MLKKIVVIGPESTGKSTLCAQLARHYKTQWVPEYARAYLLKHGTNYTLEDLYTIAEGQLKGEEDIINKMQQLQSTDLSPTPVFIDTDFIVIRVWSEFVFNNCDNRILNKIASRHYDLYLLCNTDLPWVKDELREYPDLGTREKLYHYYKETMTNQQVPWAEVRGTNDDRLQHAIEACEKILHK
ncbi:MAG: ATP-binding protein [Ferruginibacter sp.]